MLDEFLGIHRIVYYLNYLLSSSLSTKISFSFQFIHFIFHITFYFLITEKDQVFLAIIPHTVTRHLLLRQLLRDVWKFWKHAGDQHKIIILLGP